MITITAPDGQLLADQHGQFLCGHDGQLVSVPQTSRRWGLADMCAATGDSYSLNIFLEE